MVTEETSGSWWRRSTDQPQEETIAATTSETPQNVAALSGEVVAGKGLTTYKGGGLMLSIRPEHGTRKLIPYNRIEEIDINHNGTRCTIYGSASIVTIEGKGFDLLESALQRAIAWVIAIGKSDSNEVTISHITITDGAGSESLN